MSPGRRGRWPRFSHPSPTAARLRLLAVGLGIVITLACKQADSVVVVSLTAAADLPALRQLRLTLSNAGTSDAKLYPQEVGTGAISFPTSLAIVVPHGRSGALDIAVDGLAPSGAAVASGSARAVLRVGGQTDVAVHLEAGASLCGNRNLDPGETCDDGNRASGDGCDFTCHMESAGDGGAGEGPGTDGPPDASASDAGGDLRRDGAGDLMPDGSPGEASLDLGGEPVFEAPVDAPIDAPVDAPADGAGVDAPASDAPASDAPVDAAIDALLSLGDPCSSPGQCASGFCVTGVCCNSACNSTCEMACYSCTLAGSVGTCSLKCVCYTSCGFCSCTAC